MRRNDIADFILERIQIEKLSLEHCFNTSKDSIGYFFIDDVLPEDIATKIFKAFPEPNSMEIKKSLRENKYIAAQMNKYDPILKKVIFAFQDHRIVKLIGNICEINTLYPDDNLYAGGISLMRNEQFLNPHLDNSHDKDREKWRVLNLLFYVSPNWKLEYGGNLEIWPKGVNGKQFTIHSKFNRLVVMATHNTSWHSVSPITFNASRCCVSNYYFSDSPHRGNEAFHITSFRGRPKQKLRDTLLRMDNVLRMTVRKVFPKGLIKTNHIYKQ